MNKNTICGTLLGITTGIVASFGFRALKIMKQGNKYDRVYKYKCYYDMLNQWFILKNQNIFLEKYFEDNNYKSIAIYGMGEMGERLWEELNLSNKVEVKYGIDQCANAIISNVEIVNLNDNLEKVDIVVVTSIFAFDEIKKKLKYKINCPIVSLEDVIQELL